MVRECQVTQGWHNLLVKLCLLTMHAMLCAGIVVMFGSTYNGQFEDVEATDKMISKTTITSFW